MALGTGGRCLMYQWSLGPSVCSSQALSRLILCSFLLLIITTYLFTSSHKGHPPAACEDVAKWVEGGGYHDDMSETAKLKLLKQIIAKKCPACQAQVEKHDGSLW